MRANAILPGWTRNPVARAELKHQRHVIDTNRSGRVWIALALLLVVPGLLTSLAFFGAALLVPFVPDAKYVLLWEPGLALLTVLNIALYFVVTLITLALSAASISREQDAQTWDTLLTTTLAPHHIALGKWWASTRMLFGDHMMVSILRLGMTAIIVHSMRESLPPGPNGLPPEVILLPVLLLLTFIYTALDMMLTTALGVLSALLRRGGLLASMGVFTARGVVALGGLLLWVLTLLLLLQHPSGLYLLVAGGGVLVYALLIWGTLALARAVITRHSWLV